MRPLKRQSYLTVFSNGRAREVIVHIPGGTWGELGFRLKGERTIHNLPVNYLYQLAVKATVLEAKRRKKEERKLRKETD